MSKNISIKVNSGKQTIETIKLNTASDKLVIKAQAHVNYELVDEATQYAPETIDTKRVGNDLHIAFEGTDINQETDLVIEGYYENDNTELLIGMAENGKYYAYVPQSGIESDAITMLADQVFAPQALGGKEFAAPLWLLNPNWLWLAAGGLAVGGIAGSSSGSSGSKVAKPTVEAKPNGSVEVIPPADEHTKLVTVSYTGDDNKLHMVTLSKEANGKWQSSDPEIEVNSETGKVIIPSNKVKAGSKLTAKAIDHNGHEGEEVVVDVVIPAVPEAPKITANEDGSVEIVPPKDADIKSVEVHYVDNAGKEQTAIVSKGNDGNWVSNNSDLVIDPNTGKVTISASKVKDGSHVIAKAINEIGNVGEAAVDISNKAVADALDKVKAAEAAEQAAEDALAKANEDGIISQKEADDLKALNADAADKRAAADTAVKALPEGAKDADGNTKESLQGRVDRLDGITVPAVTDSNNNGIKDSDEDAIAGALEKVKAAEAAEQAAEDALAKANEDGIISQKEADDLKALNADAADKRAAADTAVKALPEGAKDADGNTKESLQGRVDRLDGITVPAVTDSNNNGIKDSDEDAIAGALEKVKAAEAAEQAAEDALAKANEDGIISQKEADDLKALNADAADKRAAADTAVKALPEGAKDADGNTKESLQGRVDRLDGITVPAVTDSNNNGIKDSDEDAIAGALEKVKAAEAAEQAAEDALAKANEDGIISQKEADDLKALNADAADKRAAADTAVKALPEGAKDADGNTKESLQGRVDRLDGITVPAVTDSNNNGIKDSDEDAIAGALEKVKAAEAAEQAAEDALAKANEDGIISQKEADDLKALNADAADKRAAADTAVKALPEGAKDADGNTKESLQGRVDRLDGITVPAVTDSNNNGIKDSDEDAIAGALEKVKAAEAAEQAAEDALAKANEDGIISQKEADDLKALNADAADKRAAADTAVKALPEGAKDADGNTKESLQGRVDRLDGITVPAVTDSNNNGIKDSDEDAIAGALEKVKAAEAAEQAAEDALAKANEDGIISQKEADDLKALNADAADKRAAADTAVKALPEGAKDADGNTKESLQGRVDRLDGITVPAVTDSNNNGIKDSDEDAIAGALEKVKAAEAAEQAAEDALAKANEDGIISQKEADDLKALNADAADKRAAADTAVKALPEGAKDADGNTKESLQGRVDRLDGITVPAVTDSNNNGIKDSDEDAIAGALEKVKAAEAAEQAAEDALAKANEDGIISQKEADDLKALNADAADKRAAADTAVKALPEGAKDADGNTKESLQGRVDRLDGITVPAVTDSNNNGIKDSDEDAIAGALEKVKAAEAAEQAAEDALAKANEDGIISQKEADDLKALNADAADKRAAADTAVKALPEGAKDADGNTKESLQGRVDRLDGITVPAVTDSNNNGIKDSDEDAIAGALEKVKAAEAAEQAAEDALAKANEDGIISQKEADDLKALNADAADKRAAADTAVKALPEGAKDADGNTKESLQGRVDRLDGITVPAVTDSNNNGIKDSDEDAIAGALEKVKAAEAAEQAAEDALAKANEDGIISQKEADDLKALNADAADKRAAADTAVKALPEGAKDADGNTKESLQGRVDRLDGITVPAVTDSNNNGIKDSDEDAIAGALEKVKAAEAAEQAAEDALAKANEDGIISQKEADDLKALNADAADKRAAADTAVKALPEGAKDADGNTKESLQGRVDRLDGITVPAVTDSNNNGIKDSDEDAIAGALEKVKAAEAAEQAAEDALAKANEDGIISQKEADDLKALNADAADKRAAADTAVKALPEGAKDADGNTKESLQGRVDRLDGITVPAVTDSNNNGIKDSDEDAIAGALEKVKAAEAAEQAAEDALAKANEDGIISQKEADDLKALNADAADKRAAADTAVKALPEGAKDADGNTKESLQGRVDRLDGITVPAVTDSNNNGIKDSDEDAIAGALEKVKAAEAAEQAAEDALAKANEDGIISQKEADDLKALNADAADKRAAADTAVKALPEGAKDADGNTKESLQGRVDRLDGITVPAVTDSNNNGIKDSDEDAIAGALEKVKAAEAAEQAAEDALAKANEDGIISQKEADDLKALNADAADKRAAADTAVKALPEGAKDADGNTKESLQGRVDRLDGITVPAVTDSNNNGIKDSDEDAIAGALEKVKAAEAAEQAAEDALAKANEDGIISQKEADDLKALNADAADKRAAADTAVKALPEGAKDADGNTKESLQGRVDRLDGITVPAVTDSNNNGIKDSDEDAIAGALEKVKAAEAAEQAAEDALAKANEDGIISQKEADDLKALNADAADKRAAADTAVKALPEGAKDADGNTKESLQGRVDRLDGITVPAVTDSNNNGIKDSDEDAIAGALEKVKAAEAAEQAAEDALAKANEDGIISQKEADDLKALNADAADKRAAADTAVKALPEGAKDADGNTKESLQGRVDRLDGITVPAVTDSNNNGIKDSDEDAIAGALEKVKAAEAAEQAAEDALAKANEDGIISQKEADDLKALNADAADKRAAADTAVKALPEGAKDADGNTKESLQGRVDRLDGITVPAVTDSNNNGIKDSDEDAIAGALEKVKAAEAAEQAAEDALAKANEDGIISQKEADDLKALNADAADKRAAADTAVKALPEGAKDADGNTKESLQGRVDRLDGITVPAVTDSNNNGIKDSDEDAIAGALEKVKAAEAAEQAAEDALAKANEDGIISQKEADDLKALNADAADKRAAADTAVKALPEGAKDADGNTKESLQGRVDRLDGITVPAVTDSNNNGIKDSDEDAIAGALEKVKAAEAAEQAAEDALAKANEDGIISQKEADDLKALNADAADKRAAADTAVKALPEGAKDADGNTKESLQGRVDRLDGITVPKVTAKVTIDNYFDDYGNAQGEFGTGTKTDDNTPTINGTITQSSGKVYLYEVVDGTLTQLGETSANASGKWEFTPDWLTNRVHTIYASSTEITSKNAAQSSIVIDVEGATKEPESIGSKQGKLWWSATTAGDIDGDGYDDVAMGSWNAGQGDILKGGLNPKVGDNIKGLGAVWHQAGVGDVNGDGYNDVLFGNAAQNNPTSTLYTGGSNGLSSSKNIGSGIAAAAGDVNGDGIVDMILMGATSSNVYYGSTSGNYTKGLNLSFGYNSGDNDASWGAQQYAAGVGDFNGDGYNDVVTTNGIYFGSKNGLSESNKISFNHAVTSANAAGDVNGDGYADVVIVDGKYGNSYVLFGGEKKDPISLSETKGIGSISGANGGFAIASSNPAYQTVIYSNAVGLGDVNGDGLSDVLITTFGNNGRGAATRIYNQMTTDSYIVFGKTNSEAVDPASLGKQGIYVPHSQADGSSSVGMVDVNGDGLGDVYVNSYNSSGRLFFGGASLGAEPTVKGSGEINGNANSNFIVGSVGNDIIHGNGGADVIYAGSGDDRIVLNADNLGYLSKGFQTDNADGSAINEGKGRLARIDGGNGHNTLAFEDDVATVDLTKISNAGTGFMKTAVGMSRIANIDHVDLTGNANKLILEAKDVLDMNHDLKSYTDAVTHQLMVTGDASDTVTIKDVANWNQSSTTASVNGKTYHVYTSTVEHGAQLLVEEHVHVEFIA